MTFKNLVLGFTLTFGLTASAATDRQLEAKTIRVGPGGGILTLQDTTDTLVGRATTDTLTNKTIGVSQLSGQVSVANGGTGASTLTANNVILGNGSSAVAFVAPSTSGNVLTSNGTTWASTAPSTGADRTERIQFGGASNVTVCSSSPCVIYSQSVWGVTSVTRSAAGQYAIVVPGGIWSAVPTCVGAGNFNGADVYIQYDWPNSTTTSLKIKTLNPTTNLAADGLASVICVGPR